MWRDDMLVEFFEEEDMGHICMMPISSQLLPNKLIWHFSNCGIFTVNSAYWVEWDYVKPSSVSAYSSDTGGSRFTSLCKAKIPPKVRNMVWRTC